MFIHYYHDVVVREWIKSISIQAFQDLVWFQYDDGRDSLGRGKAGKELLDLKEAGKAADKLSYALPSRHPDDDDGRPFHERAGLGWHNFSVCTNVVQVDPETGQCEIVCRNRLEMEVREHWLRWGPWTSAGWADDWAEFQADLALED